MSVATHLGIETAEYDRQILTFIPHYADILDAAAGALAALDRPARLLVDLGTGSRALAARCAKRLRGVRVVGIHSDAAMIGLAKKRLGATLTPPGSDDGCSVTLRPCECCYRLGPNLLVGERVARFRALTAWTGPSALSHESTHCPWRSGRLESRVSSAALACYCLVNTCTLFTGFPWGSTPLAVAVSVLPSADTTTVLVVTTLVPFM